MDGEVDTYLRDLFWFRVVMVKVFRGSRGGECVVWLAIVGK